eukprot:5819420-Amphidinium_carterae.1
MPCGPAGTTTCLVTLRVPPPQGSEQGPETHADTSITLRITIQWGFQKTTANSLGVPDWKL